MVNTKKAEEIAKLKYPRLINDPYNPLEDGNKEYRDIWIDGYNSRQSQIEQLQEELDKVKREKQLLQAIYNNYIGNNY